MIITKNKTERQRESSPTRANRFTHAGIGFPVNSWQTSSVKWLQFLAIRWYVSPWYLVDRRSMKERNCEYDISVLPNNTERRKIKPGQLLGSTSNTPLVEYSWAPNPYSMPCTIQEKSKPWTKLVASLTNWNTSPFDTYQYSQIGYTRFHFITIAIHIYKINGTNNHQKLKILKEILKSNAVNSSK